MGSILCIPIIFVVDFIIFVFQLFCFFLNIFSTYNVISFESCNMSLFFFFSFVYLFTFSFDIQGLSGRVVDFHQ